MKANYHSIDRKGYEETIGAVLKIAQAVRSLRLAGSSARSWKGSEAVCEGILPLLLPKNKCRVVVEYDPAEDKVRAYREPLEQTRIMSDLADAAGIWE